MKKSNILNKKFNRLFVVKFVEIRGTHAYWECKCDCGSIVVVRGSHLKTNSVTSCGCYSKERSSKWLSKYASSKKHKGSNNPAWKGGKATYGAFHSWLDRHYVKKKCFHCNTTSKKLDWALIKNKKHAHIRDNYFPLCRSCHVKYDK